MSDESTAAVPHLSQVFLHLFFFFFVYLLHLFFLHFLVVSTHGGGDGDGLGGGGDNNGAAGSLTITDKFSSRKPPCDSGICTGQVSISRGTKKTFEEGSSCSPELGCSVSLNSSR